MTPVLITLLMVTPTASSAVTPLCGTSPVAAIQLDHRDLAVVDTLEALYRTGRDFATFYEVAEGRREVLVETYERASVPPDLVARTVAAGGPWRILAVAMDGCSDSVNSLPYLARLVEAADNIDLRIIDSKVGRFLMDQRQTPDGRAATPTILLLDAAGREVGCWIERPAALQQWMDEHRETLTDDALFEGKMAWYREDAGKETLREIVELIERAARGEGAACAV